MSNIDFENISEVDLMNSFISKINNIKTIFEKIKEYNLLKENEPKINNLYIEKLNKISVTINDLDMDMNDIYDEFILGTDSSLLTRHDKNKQKQLIIDKKIKDTFIPLMLYYQVILQNNI
jgi:hypothetical protein